MDYLDIAGLAAAGLSAVAAVGSWNAAQRSNNTAETVARIERDRWHVERRPQFELTLEPLSSQHLRLNVHLAGPDELRDVEITSIRVDDDDKDRTGLTPGGLTREEIDNHVWGPLRFTPLVDEADRYGRAVGPFILRVGRGRPFQLEPTTPGHWMTGTNPDQWQEQYRGHPVRLVITCRVGDEEWVLPRHLPNPRSRPPFGGS
jgi:hypothetical protein